LPLPKVAALEAAAFLVTINARSRLCGHALGEEIQLEDFAKTRNVSLDRVVEGVILALVHSAAYSLSMKISDYCLIPHQSIGKA